MGSSCSSQKSVTTADYSSVDQVIEKHIDKGEKKILRINEAVSAVPPAHQPPPPPQRNELRKPSLLAERSRESSTMSSTNLHPMNMNNNNFLKDPSDIEDDMKSTGSISSERSRPPTPFSRPLTARIAQRPRTTTIFERESDQKKLQLQQQQKTNGGTDSCASSQFGGDTDPPFRGEHQHLGPGHQRDEGFPGSGRKASRQLSSADQDDIVKLKEFLSQKGL